MHSVLAASQPSTQVKNPTIELRTLYSRRNLIEHHVYHYRIAPDTSEFPVSLTASLRR
jgi:hypothetical protein